MEGMETAIDPKAAAERRVDWTQSDEGRSRLKARPKMSIWALRGEAREAQPG